MGGKRITLTSLTGLVGGVACVAIAIAEAGSLSLFINLPSFLIIVGGTICALVFSYPFCTLKTLGSVIRQAFVETSFDPIADINTILELCELSRREGLLAIESRSESIHDPFLKRGMNLLVGGSDREYLEATMINEIHQAQKLLAKSDQEKHRSEMILEGLLGIQAGKNPRALREDLLTYLTKREAKKFPSSPGARRGRPMQRAETSSTTRSARQRERGPSLCSDIPMTMRTTMTRNRKIGWPATAIWSPI